MSWQRLSRAGSLNHHAARAPGAFRLTAICADPRPVRDKKGREFVIDSLKRLILATYQWHQDGRPGWCGIDKTNRRDVMKSHAARLKDALNAAAMISPAAVLVVALMSAAPAYAAQGSDGQGSIVDPTTGQSGNSGKGSDNSGGNGGGSKASTDASKLKQNKTQPADEPAGDTSSTAGSDEKSMVFITSTKSSGGSRASLRRAQKELARLFALSDVQISAEFPSGGFDAALMNAAATARKAERAYRRARK